VSVFIGPLGAKWVDNICFDTHLGQGAKKELLPARTQRESLRGPKKNTGNICNMLCTIYFKHYCVIVLIVFLNEIMKNFMILKRVPDHVY
jgi:hypothetical protein